MILYTYQYIYKGYDKKLSEPSALDILDWVEAYGSKDITNVRVYRESIMRKVDNIVVDVSGSDAPSQCSKEALEELHTSNIEQRFEWGGKIMAGLGLREVGYHFLVSPNGTVQSGRTLDTLPPLCLMDLNKVKKESILICLMCDRKHTQQQIKATKDLVTKLRRIYRLGGPASTKVFFSITPSWRVPKFNFEDIL